MDSELKQISGIGDKTCELLIENGFSTIMSIAVASPADIASATGLSENKARKLIRSAREKVSIGIEKANAYLMHKNQTYKISTGCKSFDDMLGGGFESGSVIEIHGSWSVGKTQIAHLMAVRALVDDPQAKSMFIDTENTFKEVRIRDFAEANNLDPDDALSRIMIGRAFSSDHQLLLLDEVENIIQKDGNYKILIVDSLTSHFRSEYSGRGELAVRQQKLNKHLHQLLKIADVYNMVVIVTNQVQTDPGTFYGNPEKPIGGNIVGHGVTSRIYMRHGKGGTVFAKLIDSPYLPQNECNFIITKGGLEDA